MAQLEAAVTSSLHYGARKGEEWSLTQRVQGSELGFLAEFHE